MMCKTKLGRTLREIRQQINDSGAKLLSQDEIDDRDQAAWDEIDGRDDPDPHGRLAELRDEAVEEIRKTT